MNFESIHNYYERLVLLRIQEVAQGRDEGDDYWEDVACVALNQLPARYVRHDVDLVFYMPQQEQVDVQRAVREAVQMACEFVDQHRSGTRPNVITQARSE